MTEHEGVWTAVIRAAYAGGSGERSLNAPSCAELNRAVLVALSLLEELEEGADGTGAPVEEPATPEEESPGALELGPTAIPNVGETGAVPFARMDPEGRRPPPQAPEPEEQRDATKPAPSSDVTPRPESVVGVLGLSVALAGEGTGFATLGGELLGALDWSAHRARLAAGVRLPWERVAADHDIALDVWILSSHLDLCRGWGTRLVVSACVGPTLERVSARALGITDPRGASHWFPGAGASLGLRLSNGPRLSWATELRANTRLARVRTEVAPWGSVYEIPPWSVVLLAGPEFSL